MTKPEPPRMEIVVDGVDGTFTDIRSAEQSADYRHGVRAAAAILLGLVVLCALASLPGCLTAAKIGQWQRAVYGWGMDPSATKPCQVASAEASAYLANANRTLAEAGKITDLASDSRARELVTSAALACGRRMP